MPRRFLIASTLTLLAAGSPAARAMPAQPPKPEAPPPPIGGLLVAPGAVGPATTTTPFDAATLQRLFPDSRVEVSVPPGHQAGGPMLLVTGPGDLWIAFEGAQGTLSGATVRGAAARGPRGEAFGDNSGALGFTGDDCVIDSRSRAAVCRRPGAPRLAYVFDTRGIKGDRLVRFEWAGD